MCVLCDRYLHKPWMRSWWIEPIRASRQIYGLPIYIHSYAGHTHTCGWVKNSFTFIREGKMFFLSSMLPSFFSFIVVGHQRRRVYVDDDDQVAVASRIAWPWTQGRAGPALRALTILPRSFDSSRTCTARGHTSNT